MTSTETNTTDREEPQTPAIGLSTPVLIPAAYIKAASYTAPKNDIRHKLNNVIIDAANHAVYATNGHSMIVITNAIHIPESEPSPQTDDIKPIGLSHAQIKTLLSGVHINKRNLTLCSGLLKVSQDKVTNYEETVAVKPNLSADDQFVGWDGVRNAMPGTSDWIRTRKSCFSSDPMPMGINPDYLAAWAKAQKAIGVSNPMITPFDCWPDHKVNSLYMRCNNMEFIVMGIIKDMK